MGGGADPTSWGSPGRWPLELLGGSQAPRRAVCGTRGSLRTMHGCSVGSLGNQFRDGELPAGGSLGNALGIDTCVETKAAD